MTFKASIKGREEAEKVAEARWRRGGPIIGVLCGYVQLRTIHDGPHTAHRTRDAHRGSSGGTHLLLRFLGFSSYVFFLYTPRPFELITHSTHSGFRVANQQQTRCWSQYIPNPGFCWCCLSLPSSLLSRGTEIQISEPRFSLLLSILYPSFGLWWRQGSCCCTGTGTDRGLVRSSAHPHPTGLAATVGSQANPWITTVGVRCVANQFDANTSRHGLTVSG